MYPWLILFYLFNYSELTGVTNTSVPGLREMGLPQALYLSGFSDAVINFRL